MASLSKYEKKRFTHWPVCVFDENVSFMSPQKRLDILNAINIATAAYIFLHNPIFCIIMHRENLL